MRLAFGTAFALALAAISGYALAVNMPEIRNVGGVSFMSGGIGEAEQAYVIGRQDEFNLKLVFTLNEGNYVAGVNVALKDGLGAVLLEHTVPEPFFLAKLPAGRYTVSATYGGRTVTREAQVAGARLHTEYLRWPANPKTDLPISRWTERP